MYLRAHLRIRDLGEGRGVEELFFGAIAVNCSHPHKSIRIGSGITRMEIKTYGRVA